MATVEAPQANSHLLGTPPVRRTRKSSRFDDFTPEKRQRRGAFEKDEVVDCEKDVKVSSKAEVLLKSPQKVAATKVPEKEQVHQKENPESQAPKPSKDVGLPAVLKDVPLKSQSLLRPVLQRFGEARHREVLALHSFLGDGQARSSCLRRRCGCALHVWGPAGVGKTAVVTSYLKELGHKYISLNCYCILSRADLHRKLVMGVTRLAEEAQRAASSQVERLDSKPPRQLRAIDRLEAALKTPMKELQRLKCSQVLIVLDHVEELIGRIGLQDFELLLALPEELSCGDMLVPITISRVPLKSLGLHSTREPPHVEFQPYSESETLRLLLGHFANTSKRDMEMVNFVVYGLQKMAVPFVGWNLGLLMEVVEMVLDSLPPGAKRDTAVLQSLIKEAYQRRVGFVHKRIKDPNAKVINVSQTLSKAEMRLVLAAYLASRVGTQDDRQLFLGHSRRRRMVVRQKDNTPPALVQQPNVVTLPRLLAIYHRLALQPRLMGSNIFDGLTKLKEAGLIRFVGEKNFKVDKDIKVTCRAELPLAQACAAALKIDLTEYLCK